MIRGDCFQFQQLDCSVSPCYVTASSFAVSSNRSKTKQGLRASSPFSSRDHNVTSLSTFDDRGRSRVEGDSAFLSN